MSLLSPSQADLEAAAISAGRGATQEERELGASVLLVAAMQARESVLALKAELVRLRQLENSMRSVLLEFERPAPQTSAPSSPPRLRIVPLSVAGVPTTEGPPRSA